ncbi:putative glycosyltransferase, TIGR04372 family [Maridesulfovibrio ferrireducens]|uniref:Putative glycosyltransferase, TIGR04372 family n=1 Tax=Maridesulfovibrio ferrireducens TaxID=246191 RepID=A0A1G9B4Z7_9BACT|nr:TIGR04372 family glycosyltransferase [Maridesulfovibrio ferrireducens]SDK34601.1 putative glycosyltransferase, TIGR04372 family [Maridesulfovibrio ferrireducens]
MKKKRLLIIGTAKQSYIKDYLAKVDYNTTEVHLLVPERDRETYSLPNISYFKGNFHPLFLPLLKTMLFFKPDEAVIVCGMTYDHDNVVKAVSFYSCFKSLKVKISVRNIDVPADANLRPSPAKEIAKWAGLGTIALLIKAVSFFKKIRVGEIYSTRLGHLTLECEIYLSETDLGRHDGYLDLFYFKDDKVANKTIASLYARKMKIHRFNKHLLDAIRRFNMAEQHELLLNTRIIAFSRDFECMLQQADRHIAFTEAQVIKGSETLKSMGVDPTLPHVCLLGRDSVFLQGAIPVFNDGDMQRPRNMDIDTFKSGTEELLKHDYNVLRMGSVVKAPLQIDHPNFIDYATSGIRSDFMDIYLTSKCSFFVGIQSGLQHVASAFRIPCLRVNVARLEMIEYCYPEDLILFKLLWSKREKRILKVSEQLESGISRWPIEKFINSDIEVIDNTGDELREAMLEMHQRINGTWKTSPEDIELQNKYRSFFKVSELNSRFDTPVSSYFLRKHAAELF